jgi:acetylornithine deacetylase
VTDLELLALHRAMIEIPSLSGDEGALCGALIEWLSDRGFVARRLGNNVFAAVGSGPTIALNSHLDTVPASSGWTRDPHQAVVVDGKVHGLGSNDAKAAAACMVAAFARLAPEVARLGIRLLLTLSAEEEVGGRGSEILVPELDRLGLAPEAVIVGEPTGLDIAIAQKGLLVLELRTEGRACHAAHGRFLDVPNALSRLARGLVALEAVEFGGPHPLLGPVTVEPTMVKGGIARNMIPPEASCLIDVRTNPTPDQRATYAKLAAVVAEGELVLISERLRPYEIDVAHPLLAAARSARPQAALFGSRGLSDLVFFHAPGIKVGPGRTERSHTPDEFVFESEVIEGAQFYERAVRAWAASLQGAPA